MKGLNKEVPPPMPRLYYCDESSNEADDPRIGIAACGGSLAQWVALEAAWTHTLNELKIAPGDFHATRAKEDIRMALAQLMFQAGILTACATVRLSDFAKVTDNADGGNYGGAYGFARYMLLLQISWAADDLLDNTPIEIQIDQGGKGGEWFIEKLDEIAAHDELRSKYRLIGHGTVDRRQDVRVHCPDLISHELLTDRHTSPVLKVFGDRVLVDDWTADNVSEAITEFNRHRDWLKRHFEAEEKRAKADRKNHDGPLGRD